MLDFFSALVGGYLILVALWLLTIIIVFVTLFKRKDLTKPLKIFNLVFGLQKRKNLLNVDKEKNEP